MVYVDYNVPLFSVKHAIITFLNISFNFNLLQFQLNLQSSPLLYLPETIK